MTEKYVPPPSINYVVHDKNGQRLEMKYALNEPSEKFYLSACKLVYRTVQIALKEANAKA